MYMANGTFFNQQTVPLCCCLNFHKYQSYSPGGSNVFFVFDGRVGFTVGSTTQEHTAFA